jgi:hypothetical protein
MSSSETTGEMRPDDEQFVHITCHNGDFARSFQIARSWALNWGGLALSKAPNWGKLPPEPGAIWRIPVSI